MSDKQWKKFWKIVEYHRIKKAFSWRKLKIAFEFGELRTFWEQWQHQRMQKQIAWVIGPNDCELREGVDTLPPTPRQQIEAVTLWHKKHIPPVTEGAQLATRWADDQVLKVKIPSGWTQQQKKQVVNAISGFMALCNMEVIGSPPPKFEEAPVE